MKSKKDFNVGDKVFAKVKGYPPWPATVDEIKGKKYSVTFYGTKETSKLKLEDLCDYLENRDKITVKYSKKKGFLDSVRELEEELSGSNTTVREDVYKEDERLKQDDESELNNDDTENFTEDTPSATQNRKKRSLSSSQSSEDLPKAKRPAVSRKSSTASNASSQKKHDSPEHNTQYTYESPLRLEENEIEKDEQSPGPENNLNSTVNGRNYEIVFADELCEKTKYILEQMEAAHPDGNPPPTVDDELFKKKNLLLIARIPQGDFVGIEIADDRPEQFNSEMERIQWTGAKIRNLLRFKTDIESGSLSPKRSDVVLNPQLTIEERILAIEKCVVDRKQERLHWLQLESKLVEYDSEIKTHLGLEKADTEKALHCLEQISTLPIEQLMLTKHPHVVEMVRRLRRYIGNIKAWNLTPEQQSEFMKGAEKIRKKADEVYQKFKELYGLSPQDSFTEIYNSYVKEFNLKTKHMKEAQRFAVCAKPGTPQFDTDQMDDQLELEAIKLKNDLENKKNRAQTVQDADMGGSTANT